MAAGKAGTGAAGGGSGWTPFVLFARRARRYWGEQLRVWRTVLDWTVWVYLVVPALLIGGGIYGEWWQQPPEWMTGIPLALAGIPFILMLFKSRLRVFLEDADVLFLMQRNSWTARITGYGALYSALTTALTTVLALVPMLPWLSQVHGWGAEYLAAWALFVWSVRVLFAVAERGIRTVWPGWRTYLLLVPLWLACAAAPGAAVRLAGDPAALGGGAAAVLLGATFTGWRTMNLRGAFEADIERERKARLASTEMLLAGAGVVERKPIVRLRRPLLFRRSGRLFRGSDPGTMLAEMRIKSFVRKMASVRLWFGFVSVSTAAMLTAPPWLALAALALLPIPAAAWLHGHWREWFDGDFVSQFRWDDVSAVKGATLSRFWLLAPAVAWLALLAGWRAAGPAWMLLVAAAGIAFWYMLNGMLGVFWSVRKR